MSSTCHCVGGLLRASFASLPSGGQHRSQTSPFVHTYGSTNIPTVTLGGGGRGAATRGDQSTPVASTIPRDAGCAGPVHAVSHRACTRRGLPVLAPRPTPPNAICVMCPADELRVLGGRQQDHP
jgi:hypothetical protein